MHKFIRTTAVAVGLAFASLSLPLAASATESTPPAPEICYGEPIPGTPEIPAVPAVPAVTELVVDVPAQAAEYSKSYEYNKQTKTTRTHKHGKVELVSDWSWWAGNAPKYSDTNPEVLESGHHGSWSEGPWDYERVYRYVSTGKVTETLVKEAVAATYKEIIITPAVDEIPAVPATPDIPVVIDCPVVVDPPVDPPVEEPTDPEPPVVVPDPPVVAPVVPAPEVVVPVVTPEPVAPVASPVVVEDGDREELAVTGASFGTLGKVGAGVLAFGLALLLIAAQARRKGRNEL